MFVSGGSLVLKTPGFTSQGYFPYMPGMSSSNYPTAYGAIYSSQLWVYVVVSKRAGALGRLPLKVYRDEGLDRPEAPEHPMARLLANPNPGLSAFDLKVWTCSTKDTFGEAFWLKRYDDAGTVRELYPMHPAFMRYEDKSSDWTFDNGSLLIEHIPESALVHFKSYHPTSMSRGMSPLEPLRATLENEFFARRSTASFWQRGARPGFVLKHPKELSDGAQRRLKTQFDEISGGYERTGATVVLEEGMDAQALTLTAEEAQYVETRKLNREEVCAAYDMPPPAVHILDHATFSNITEQNRMVYRDTMAPVVGSIEATIELDLRQAEWPNDDVYAEFLMDGVLRGDFEARQDALAKASHMTIAEKRRIENLPFIEGTDRIFLNAAEQPMPVPQTGDAPAAPPFQQVGLPALIEAGVINEQDARRLLGIDGSAPGRPAEVVPLPVARSLMGRLSWQKSLAQVDVDALVADLTDEHADVIRKALSDETAEGGSVASLRGRIRSLVKE